MKFLCPAISETAHFQDGKGDRVVTSPGKPFLFRDGALTQPCSFSWDSFPSHKHLSSWLPSLLSVCPSPSYTRTPSPLPHSSLSPALPLSAPPPARSPHSHQLGPAAGASVSLPGSRPEVQAVSCCCRCHRGEALPND